MSAGCRSWSEVARSEAGRKARGCCSMPGESNCDLGQKCSSPVMGRKKMGSLSNNFLIRLDVQDMKEKVDHLEGWIYIVK